MARTEATLSACMITQETQNEFFTGWTADELKAIEAADAQQIGYIIACKLYAVHLAVVEWHCVIHDDDWQESWDDSAHQYVLTKKHLHFHWVGKFWKGPDGKVHGGTVSQIAAAVGVQPEYVEKPKRGKYAWDNMLAYLVHIKYTDKTAYPPDAVVSGGLVEEATKTPLWTPYNQIYALRKSDWEKGRAKVTADRAKVDIDALEERILRGEVTRNQVMLTDSMYEVYARNKRRCDDAFATYQERKIAKTVQAMESGEFKLSVYYITGRSHAGKSVFTDKFVEHLQEASREKFGEPWSVCQTAATNPMDDYDGSEIMVMDDLRGVAMSASDWLKLLDPDRANIASARYRNKRIACRAIIINSERDILDFFYFLKGSGGGDRAEAMDQFFRRILAHVTVYRVPDDPETRRALVGEMRETQPYDVSDPAAKAKLEDMERTYDTYQLTQGYYSGSAAALRNKTLRLRHDFNANVADMDYEAALDRLTELTMSRNADKQQA